MKNVGLEKNVSLCSQGEYNFSKCYFDEGKTGGALTSQIIFNHESLYFGGSKCILLNCRFHRISIVEVMSEISEDLK